MKQFLLWIFLFIFTSANAAEVDSMFVGGAAYKLLHISNDRNSGYLYAENYQHRKILVYKPHSPYPPDSTFGLNQLDGTDILDIMFQCNKDICTRYLNRRTNELSRIYTNILDYDGQKDVIAYYMKDKSLIVINRVFKTCKKPSIYYLKLFPNSDFGIKTQFLKNGDLRLDYAEAKKGNDAIKIIHINYSELLRDCANR
ncbi:MAG: hypothetical protein JSR33_11640 [Proteobacteria bacterium]|nr:hypothetical protein [Pseudomonadota bacterium]